MGAVEGAALGGDGAGGEKGGIESADGAGIHLERNGDGGVRAIFQRGLRTAHGGDGGVILAEEKANEVEPVNGGGGEDAAP